MLAKRALGQTGLNVPVLGFGVSGPLGSPFVSERNVISLIQTAHAGGATLFDTAPFYGQAEHRLGKALKQFSRDSFTLCVKAGTRRENSRVIKDFTEAGLRASLETSLQRLGVAHVDIFLLHGPSPRELTPDLRKTLDRLQSENLIRASGICGRGPEILTALERGFGAVIQAPVFSEWPGVAAKHGAGFLGIEAIRPAAPDLRPIRSPADLWYAARALKHGQGETGDPSASLARALAAPISAVIATTTRQSHLTANLAVARETR